MQNKILSLLVDNTSGVLSRIAGMFSRRGYNIDSITAGVTADVNYTRITVVCSGDDAILDQIVKQLAKLVDVRDIKVLDPSDSVVRETVLVKVAAAPEQRQGIVSIADIFRAKVVDVSKDSLIVEMTGSKTKLEAFIDLMGDYEILELARAGVMGLERGSHGVKFLSLRKHWSGRCRRRRILKAGLFIWFAKGRISGMNNHTQDMHIYSLNDIYF